MEISLPSLLLGAAGVAACYFAYLCATKGVPAAWAWIKSKVSSAESAIVAEVQKDIAALKTDVTAIKSKVGL